MVFVDDLEGISVEEARNVVGEMSRLVEHPPTVSGAPRKDVDTDGMNSADPLYQILEVAFQSGAIAAAGGLAIRSLTRLATALIQARAGRRVHLKLASGAEVTVEGGGASADELGKVIVKLIDEPAQPTSE